MPPAGSAHDHSAWTDGELWYLISYGDHDAFAALYDRHAQAIWNYACRLAGSSPAAEDLLATTFMTAWQRRREVRLIRDSALPWLYTVTANLSRQEHRRRRRFLRIAPKLVSEPTPDHAEKISDDNAVRQRLHRVLAAIDELPPAEQEAVKICLLGEMTTADAAELLGVSETGIRSRLSRARARLHKLTEDTNE
ncbi:RNA polymerase sigma factor [Amycolatopsis pithecellobii]|uniref:Sigma-70 family RNA polymerase sigma factor n=1 Tax=Amycolatopsis pithecellobii TaxID=664692 RepID=A0A6N7YPU2_9PSEU|nr:RNA polymerase sigma factor [Amycolatopsis pithecellobii]MTD53908.1 sigma-70 family RNA polymerase sigma factor [Amycolatopsis pithecellobii]